MKTKLLLLTVIVSLLFVPKAHAQYPVAVVEDPIAQINHAEDITKWVQSIDDLNTQIQQFQQDIQIAQTVEGYIGNPAQAAQAMELQLLDSTGLTQSVGQLTSALNQTVDGAMALENSGSQLFNSVSSLTPEGLKMSFDPSHFIPYSAIQNQSANVSTVIKNTASLIHGLQQQKATTLAQIQAAPDQSTVQKLTAQINGIDGQIAALGQQQQTSTDQIVTQNIANQNDKEMKAQAANEAADHEMSVSTQNFMQWQGQISGSTTDFQ
jgi:conjugal transfer/entry exclusion protein